MTATLTDVVSELKTQRKGQDKLISGQNNLVDAISRMSNKKSSSDRLQELEDKSEAQPGSAMMASFTAGQQAGEDVNFGWLLNPMLLLKPLLVGAAGVAAAFAGLRGWELKVLKNIDTIGDVLKTAFTPITNIASRLTASFTSFVDDLTRGTLTRFGIDPETGRMTRDAAGRFTGKETKTTAQMIQEAMQALKTRAFSFFGLGPAGGLADDALKAADNTPSAISRVTSAFSKIMTPFRAIYNGVEGFITGPGAKIFGFIDGVLGISKAGSALAGLTKVLGKVLWPIGIIMSLFDGVNAWREENGSQYDKITAGISATVGDFIGAPLDLLKGLLAWVLGKFGFDETAQAIQDFSIEEKLTNLLNGIFDFPQKAFEWIKGAISDPTAALESLWTSLVGENGLFGVISDWLIGFYEWFVDLLPDVGAMASQLKQQLVDILPDWAKDLIGIDENQLSADQRRQTELASAQENLANLRTQEADLRASTDPQAGYALQGNQAAQAAIEKQIATLANELGVDTGTPLSIPSTGVESLMAPVSQTGSRLTTSEVVEGVRNSQQPTVIPVPVPQAAPAPAGNGNGGGAYLLPAAPTMDVMDPVSQYFNSN